MRNLLPFVMIFFVLGACDKIDDLTKFDIEYQSQVVIPASAGVDLPFSVFTPETETDSESRFEVNDTRKDLIEEIILTELQMVITSPSGSDFSFLNSIKVYIAAEGLEEVLIAEQEVPDGVGSTLDVDVLDIDLQEYIKKDEFNLRIKTVTDEIIESDHEIDITSTFFVDARILGI